VNTATLHSHYFWIKHLVIQGWAGLGWLTGLDGLGWLGWLGWVGWAGWLAG
jgi:hypothetical protein